MGYKTGPPPCPVGALRETASKSSTASDPGVATAATVPAPGERFSDEDLHIMYGVPADGCMRVSRKNRCMVLARPAGSPSGHAGAGRDAGMVHMVQASDRAGSGSPGVSCDGLALARSREDGYTVLCFTRDGDALVFNSRVEYDSHEFRVEADADGGAGGVVEFRLRTVGGGTPTRRRPAGAPLFASAAGPSSGALRGDPDPDTAAMVERAISMQASFESRGHLTRALPRDVDALTLDRVLECLLRASKIDMDGDSIRRAPGSSGSAAACRGERGGTAGPGPSFAGTFLEGIGDDRASGETVGEYIVRLVNTDEPGAFDGEDAKEIDEGLRQMARGECYTYEQMRKELCP